MQNYREHPLRAAMFRQSFVEAHRQGQALEELGAQMAKPRKQITNVFKARNVQLDIIIKNHVSIKILKSFICCNKTGGAGKHMLIGVKSHH